MLPVTGHLTITPCGLNSRLSEVLHPEFRVVIDTVNYFAIRKEPISVISENTPWISSSAIGGLRSLEIALSFEQDAPEASYRVNLYFSELENKQPGERVFNVRIQNETVLENFDIVKEAGKNR